jgi:WD40 repeat protein
VVADREYYRSEVVTSLVEIASAQDICWSPDGEHLAISVKNDIKIWNTQNWNVTKTALYQWELNSPANSLAWSPDGANLACAMYDRSVGVLDWSKVQYLEQESVDQSDMPMRMSGFPGKVNRLAWADLHPDTNFPPLLAASTREIVSVWVKTPLDWESWVLELSSGNVIDVAFQPKSGVLASLAEDGWIVLWQAAVEAVQVLDGAEEGFCCLAWHPTGCRLAAGGKRGELFVWSVCG